MSLRKATVHFYDTSKLDIRNKIISIFLGSKMCHCAIEIEGVGLLTYTDKTRGIKCIPLELYHSMVCIPLCSVEVGLVDSRLIPPLDIPYNISGTKYFLWHIIGRFLGFPMPNSCATYVSSMLIDNNIITSQVFYPDVLHKELTKCR
jgi:hypothetical protein